MSVLIFLFAAFLKPTFYSPVMFALCGAVYANQSITSRDAVTPAGARSLAAILLLLAAFAFLGPTFGGIYGSQNLDALKFLVGVATFMAGVALGMKGDRLSQYFPYFLVAITIYYLYHYLEENLIDQDALLYPPDNNNSAAMLSLFLPLVALQTRKSIRLVCLSLFAAFSFFVASRALLALTVFTFSVSTPFVRRRPWMLFFMFPVAFAIFFYKGLSLDNFSDRIRLEIIRVSWDYALTSGANAFNFGEATFTNFLNVHPIYPGLEVQHAHNIFLEIWVAYGIVPLIVFCAFLLGLAVNAYKQRNNLLLWSLGVFLVFGMIEALIMDVRAFGTILFVLGYCFARGQESMSSPTTVATAQLNSTSEPAPRGIGDPLSGRSPSA